jgi:hypothetical protein
VCRADERHNTGLTAAPGHQEDRFNKTHRQTIEYKASAQGQKNAPVPVMGTGIRHHGSRHCLKLLNTRKHVHAALGERYVDQGRKDEDAYPCPCAAETSARYLQPKVDEDDRRIAKWIAENSGERRNIPAVGN